MSNWILDLNKLVNTKEYPEKDLEVSAHDIITSYGQSNNEKERNNIKSNIKLYINNLKDRINDPIILKKYNLLLTIEKELGVVDQTHPIEPIIKPEGPKINTDPENMVMPSNIIIDKREVKKKELSYAEQDELIKMDEEAEESVVKESVVEKKADDDIEIPDKIELDGEIIDLHAPAPTDKKIYDNMPLETEEEAKIRNEVFSKLDNVESGIKTPYEVKSEVVNVLVDPNEEKLNEIENIVKEIDEDKFTENEKFEYNDALTQFMNTYNSAWIPDEVKNTLLNNSYNKIKEIYEKYKKNNEKPVMVDETLNKYPKDDEIIEKQQENHKNDIKYLKKIFMDKYNSLQLDYLNKKEDMNITSLFNKVNNETNDYTLIENSINELEKYEKLIDERKFEYEEDLSINNDEKPVEKPKLMDEAEVIEVEADEKPKSDRVPNPNVKESNVSFDEIAEKIYKEPDTKILRGNGTKLEKLIKYRNSEINGRKVYLPDSNYEVIVNQVHDRTQINFMYNLMLQNGINIDDLESSIKEEFIHILFDHCLFPLQEDLTYNEFIRNLSPNDLELLFVVFSLVNTKVDKDGILPLHIPYVQCDNCESPISLKEEMVLDLTQEFKNIYDTERFISNYKIYRNSNFKSIKEAYISGEYGKITKLSYKEDSSFSYEAYICRPTVQKQLLIKSNNELIAYRSMANSFTKRASYLRKTMPNIDDLINYLSSHSYAQFKGDVDYINKNGINLSDPNISDENKLLLENVTAVLTNMEDVLKELSPVFFAALIIDTVIIKTIDNFETSFTLNEGDIYEFIEVIKDQLPPEFTQELAERAEEMDYTSKDVKIFFTADEIGDKLDFYSVYKKPDELEKVLKENGADEETIKTELERINKIKEEFDHTHRCTKCGHSIYKVGYNTLLFFSITNLLS